MTRKPVHVFLLHAGFCLALLSAFSGARETYPRLFHAIGNEAMQSLGKGRSVRLQRTDPASRHDSADTEMLGRTRGQLDYTWSAVYSSHRRLFWPSVFFIALMVATPMSRRRLVVGVVSGLVLFNAFFVLEALGLSMVLFGAMEPVARGDTTMWSRHLPVAQAMFNSPITNFSAVFFLWAWLAQPARGIDLESLNALIRRILTPAGAAPAPPPASGASEPAKSDDPPS